MTNLNLSLSSLDRLALLAIVVVSLLPLVPYEVVNNSIFAAWARRKCASPDELVSYPPLDLGVAKRWSVKGRWAALHRVSYYINTLCCHGGCRGRTSPVPE